MAVSCIESQRRRALTLYEETAEFEAVASARTCLFTCKGISIHNEVPAAFVLASREKSSWDLHGQIMVDQTCYESDWVMATVADRMRRGRNAMEQLLLSISSTTNVFLFGGVEALAAPPRERFLVTTNSQAILNYVYGCEMNAMWSAKSAPLIRENWRIYDVCPFQEGEEVQTLTLPPHRSFSGPTLCLRTRILNAASHHSSTRFGTVSLAP